MVLDAVRALCVLEQRRCPAAFAVLERVLGGSGRSLLLARLLPGFLAILPPRQKLLPPLLGLWQLATPSPGRAAAELHHLLFAWASGACFAPSSLDLLDESEAATEPTEQILRRRLAITIVMAANACRSEQRSTRLCELVAGLLASGEVKLVHSAVSIALLHCSWLRQCLPGPCCGVLACCILESLFDGVFVGEELLNSPSMLRKQLQSTTSRSAVLCATLFRFIAPSLGGLDREVLIERLHQVATEHYCLFHRRGASEEIAENLNDVHSPLRRLISRLCLCFYLVIHSLLDEYGGSPLQVAASASSLALLGPSALNLPR
jgi:hypothetical protein